LRPFDAPGSKVLNKRRKGITSLGVKVEKRKKFFRRTSPRKGVNKQGLAELGSGRAGEGRL